MAIYYNNGTLIRLNNVDYLNKYVVLDCSNMRFAKKATFFKKAVEEIKPVPSKYGIYVLYSSGKSTKVEFKTEHECNDAFDEMRSKMEKD